MKKTVVIGASPNPERYSYKAIHALVQHGYDTIGLGFKQGTVAGINILQKSPTGLIADTITLYVGPANQHAWLQAILELSPRRVIFNPGTENPIIEDLLISKGVVVEHACTLVLLASNQY
jgi:predicted CoA-binding protein